MPAPAYLTLAIEYIDSWFEHQKHCAPQVPGFSLAIAYRGTVLFNKAWGYANIENRESLTPHHLFRIASHSKTFTAIAIMQWVEKGRIKLDDPVSQHLTFLQQNPDRRNSQITIRQLLSHSAGIIRDGEDSTFWGLSKDFPNKEDLIDFF